MSTVARYQFEVRYPPILNFSPRYRDMVAPYVRDCDGFQVDKAESVEEKIVMRFDAEKIIWEVRWDRMFIVSEGNVNRLRDRNSFSKFFFELLERLRTFESFGGVRTFFSRMHCIVPTSDNLNLYLKKHLQMDGYPPPLNSENITDIGIVYEGRLGVEKEIRVAMGPFDKSKDIERHKLLPFQSIDLMNNLMSSNGILIDSLITLQTQTFDFQILNDALQLHSQSSTIQ